jgi:hypothetical protein
VNNSRIVLATVFGALLGYLAGLANALLFVTPAAAFHAQTFSALVAGGLAFAFRETLHVRLGIWRGALAASAVPAAYALAYSLLVSYDPVGWALFARTFGCFVAGALAERFLRNTFDDVVNVAENALKNNRRH